MFRIIISLSTTTPDTNILRNNDDNIELYYADEKSSGCFTPLKYL